MPEVLSLCVGEKSEVAYTSQSGIRRWTLKRKIPRILIEFGVSLCTHQDSNLEPTD